MKDYPAAISVQQATLTEHHPYQYADNILYSGGINLVATRDETVVGFLSVLLEGYDPDGAKLWHRLRPYLAFVGVLPELQRSGIGKMLVERVAQIILPELARGIWVECPEDSAGFYEKLGFVRRTPEFILRATGLSPFGPVYFLPDSR